MNVKEFIDLHVHIGPEIFPRKFTVQTLIRKERGKINGMALKNHLYPTMPLINSVENDKEIVLIGSVTLNNYLGGLNPDAIYASAKISELPIIVWFPTINANNFLAQSKYEIAPEWVKDKNFISRKSSEVKPVEVLNKGKLTVEAIECLRMIKKCKAVLATGHISSKETIILVREALILGIKKIIITHPIYQKITMSNKLQKKLANKGCFIEIPYSMYSIDKIPIEKIVEEIKSVGYKNTVLSSDMGQIYSLAPSVALKKFAELLILSGIKEEEIFTMLVKNPKKLLSK